MPVGLTETPTLTQTLTHTRRYPQVSEENLRWSYSDSLLLWSIVNGRVSSARRNGVHVYLWRPWPGLQQFLWALWISTSVNLLYACPKTNKYCGVCAVANAIALALILGKFLKTNCMTRRCVYSPALKLKCSFPSPPALFPPHWLYNVQQGKFSVSNTSTSIIIRKVLL